MIRYPQLPPQTRDDLQFMIDDFARVTPGVRAVVLLSTDGLAMLWYGLEREAAEKLAALTCSALGTGRALGAVVGETASGTGQMIIQFPSGAYFVLGAVGATAGLGVTVERGAQLQVVVQQMKQLSDSAGARLAPPLAHMGGAQ